MGTPCLQRSCLPLPPALSGRSCLGPGDALHRFLDASMSNRRGIRYSMRHGDSSSTFRHVACLARAVGSRPVRPRRRALRMLRTAACADHLPSRRWPLVGRGKRVLARRAGPPAELARRRRCRPAELLARHARLHRGRRRSAEQRPDQSAGAVPSLPDASPRIGLSTTAPAIEIAQARARRSVLRPLPSESSERRRVAAMAGSPRPRKAYRDLHSGRWLGTDPDAQDIVLSASERGWWVVAGRGRPLHGGSYRFRRLAIASSSSAPLR